jgi:hypothetical protein
MRYIKLVSGEPVAYSLIEFRRDANVSMRGDPDPAFLAQYGVYPVAVAEQPTLAAGEIASLKELPELVGGVWVRGWNISTVTATAEMVKAEAYRRIVAILPEWKQRNLTAQATILAEKGRANWTPEELAAWDAGSALWSQVAAIREASDVIEGLDPIPSDYAADQRWVIT